MRLLILLVLLAFAPAVSAQNRDDAKILTVRGWATVQVRPDVELFSFRVSSFEQSAQEAQKAQRGKVTAILLRLRKVLPPEIALSEGNLAFSYSKPRQVICTSFIGFRLPHVDQIELEELSRRTAEIIDTAISAGADSSDETVGPVRFQVSDSAGLHQMALEAAIADARSRAKKIADGAGLKVGPIHGLEEFTPRASAVTPLRLEENNSGIFEMTVQVTLSLSLE